MTIAQTERLGDWIAGSGKRLQAIYVTHAHGDHWFGANLLGKRFPGLVVYTTPATVALMPFQVTVGREKVFDPDFPGQIGETPIQAQPVPVNGFALEGDPLVPIEVGHANTLRDVKRLVAAHPTPQAYFEQMVALYPERLNHGPLWSGGNALLASG
jgi:glyoxylase-like metal-dependent hydrolase (beta-lactamase superfamily II)